MVREAMIPGTPQPRADKHGDKGLSGKTELAEYTVKDERYTRHVAAGLKEREEQEQNEHLGHEAEHRAHTRYDTVVDETAEPVGRARLFKSVAYKHRDSGHPHSVGGGVGLVEALVFEVLDGVNIAHRHGCLFSAFERLSGTAE